MNSKEGISCVVGLGNPGIRYQNNRHNSGFWLIDELARKAGGLFRKEHKFFGELCRIQLGGSDCWLLKPETFMNRSGQSVSALTNFYKIPPANILIVHDELDLACGAVKLKKGGGHGGHNGLRDIISALGTPEFWRLRLGIGHPGSKDQVVDYVLADPSKAEHDQIYRAIDIALAQAPLLADGDFDKFMNLANRKE